MTKTNTDKAAQDILDLLRGAPGPYFETESSFFGKKRVDSSMKESPMETDMGGMIITKASMTYGEADSLASSVDLTGYPAFVRRHTQSVYWNSPYNKNPPPPGLFFKGDAWWSIYSYLVTQGVIEGDPKSYKNQMEYLYNQILHRLVEAGVWLEAVNEDENARWIAEFGEVLVDGKWRWFKLGVWP